LWASKWSATGGIVGKLVEACVRDLQYVDTAGRRVDQPPDVPLRVAPVRISSSNCDGSSLRRRSTVSRSLVARRTEDGGRADDPSGVPVIQVSRWLGHAPPATLLHPRAVEPDAPLGCGDFGFAEMSDAAATVSM
jgi:hypothetical protein